MRTNDIVRRIQANLSNHYAEIKKLQNSNDENKHQKINFLAIEYGQFKIELNKEIERINN
jgi:hypothetical protein